jgi:hypothetical protein
MYEKIERKSYNSLGSMVKAGDYDVLKEYLEEYKANGKIPEILEVQQGYSLCPIDILLCEAPKFHENEKNTDIIKLLIEYGANPNCSDKNGITPLMFSASANDIGAMQVLIDSGADINQGDGASNRILYHAVMGEAEDAITFIANDLGVDINKPHPLTTETVLHNACYGAKEKSVYKLMELGVDPTIETEDGDLAGEFIPDGEDWNEMFERMEQYVEEFKANQAPRNATSLKM